MAAIVQRGCWVQSSLPCTLVDQKRLVYYRQVKLLDNARCRHLRCVHGEGEDQSIAENNAPGSALKRLDSYFDRLQKQAEPAIGEDRSGSEGGGGKQELAAPEGTAKDEAEIKNRSLDQVHDEYALKEELIATVLKEFEAAEFKEMTRGASTKNTSVENKEGKPLLVLRSSSTGGVQVGTARKELPLFLLRPGSFIVSTLVSIDIGVYVFGLASSQQTQNAVDLAFLQGAKVNELILAGEWWRLFTPMFLHSGLLHLFLSCWAMISFGPQVEGLYGSSGLLLIYLLGGMFGNLTSFLQTSQTTVGGTGPVFAVICSWIVFLVKNRETVRAFDTLDLMQKVLIFSALSVLLGNELPVDAWAHVGGALVGILFGAVASPWYRAVDAAELDSKKTDLTLERLALAFLLCSGALLLLYYCALEDGSEVFTNLY